MNRDNTPPELPDQSLPDDGSTQRHRGQEDPSGIQDEVRQRSSPATFPNKPVVHNDGGDLPVIGAPAPGGEVTPRHTRTPPTQRPGSGVEPVGAGHENQTQMTAVFGDVKRIGSWTVPASTKANVLFGNIYWDLREARFSAEETLLEAFVLFGDLRVIVPPGTRVVTDGGTVLGNTTVNLGSTPPNPNAPLVRLRISGATGDVKVRAFEPGEKIPKRWRWF